MKREEKLNALRCMRKSISDRGGKRMAFLCHEFVDSLGADTLGFNSAGRMMREEFPELAKEIERTGKKNEPDYSFPMALDFKDRSGKLRIRVQGHVMIAWYNNKKLEIIDRVEESLNRKKSKRQA